MPPRMFKIGVISSSDEGLETTVPLYQQIIKPDINAYVNKLPNHRFRPQPEFEFLIESAEGSADIHLQKVQDFHQQGVDLVIGGGWSSHAYVSREYVNDNNMLLFSSSSTYPGLAIPDDNLYRMCPDDHQQAPAMAEMIWSRGVQAVIVIHRDDVYGNGLYDALKNSYEGKGGVIHARITYPPETQDFTNIMNDAENAAVNAVAEYGVEHVGVVMISFAEGRTIVGMADNYPTLYGLTWFGPESTGASERMLEENPQEACHLKLVSTLFAPEDSLKYREMSVRYKNHTGYDMRYYAACEIDVAWVIAMAILETQSSDARPMDAADVIKVIPDVASRYFGYSGWCLLNDAGDRYESDYDIWGYGYDDETGDPAIKKYGVYDSMTGQVTWLIT